MPTQVQTQISNNQSDQQIAGALLLNENPEGADEDLATTIDQLNIAAALVDEEVNKETTAEVAAQEKDQLSFIVELRERGPKLLGAFKVGTKTYGVEANYDESKGIYYRLVEIGPAQEADVAAFMSDHDYSHLEKCEVIELFQSPMNIRVIDRSSGDSKMDFIVLDGHNFAEQEVLRGIINASTESVPLAGQDDGAQFSFTLMRDVTNARRAWLVLFPFSVQSGETMLDHKLQFVETVADGDRELQQFIAKVLVQLLQEEHDHPRHDQKYTEAIRDYLKQHNPELYRRDMDLEKRGHGNGSSVSEELEVHREYLTHTSLEELKAVAETFHKTAMAYKPIKIYEERVSALIHQSEKAVTLKATEGITDQTKVVDDLELQERIKHLANPSEQTTQKEALSDDIHVQAQTYAQAVMHEAEETTTTPADTDRMPFAQVAGLNSISLAEPPEQPQPVTTDRSVVAAPAETGVPAAKANADDLSGQLSVARPLDMVKEQPEVTATVKIVSELDLPIAAEAVRKEFFAPDEPVIEWNNSRKMYLVLLKLMDFQTDNAQQFSDADMAVHYAQELQQMLDEASTNDKETRNGVLADITYRADQLLEANKDLTWQEALKRYIDGRFEAALQERQEEKQRKQQAAEVRRIEEMEMERKRERWWEDESVWSDFDRRAPTAKSIGIRDGNWFALLEQNAYCKLGYEDKFVLVDMQSEEVRENLRDLGNSQTLLEEGFTVEAVLCGRDSTAIVANKRYCLLEKTYMRANEAKLDHEDYFFVVKKADGKMCLASLCLSGDDKQAHWQPSKAKLYEIQIDSRLINNPGKLAMNDPGLYGISTEHGQQAKKPQELDLRPIDHRDNKGEREGTMYERQPQDLITVPMDLIDNTVGTPESGVLAVRKDKKTANPKEELIFKQAIANLGGYYRLLHSDQGEVCAELDLKDGEMKPFYFLKQTDHFVGDTYVLCCWWLKRQGDQVIQCQGLNGWDKVKFSFGKNDDKINFERTN